MYRSVPRLLKSPGNVVRGIFGKKTEPVKNLTVEERENLRKTLPSITAHESAKIVDSEVEIAEFEADEILNSRIDGDSIRARGFLKYNYNYQPSKNVRNEVIETARKCLEKAGINSENVEKYSFEQNGDNTIKFEVLKTLGENIGHWPNNGKLVYFETIEDVAKFYETPVSNITDYVKTARDENKPKNVKMLENAVRFHPEDKHLYHGGVTAFPGTGGKVLSLRQKRLLRQYEPKKEWFDYEDVAFDYSKPDKDMPWDPEVANQMDRYADKRYNLKTKQFTRIRQ